MRIPAVAACVALLVAVAGCTDERERDVQAPAVDEAAPGWSKLDAPPVAHEWAVSLWTGDRLFLWGGERERAANPYRADGLLFDSDSGWERVARGPLRPRLSAGAAWTGTEALIWGGWAGAPLADGAAFDPQRRAWRRLPAAPLSAREPAITVWTGSELIVWGDRDRSAEARDGAAYDPRADRWRRLAPAPLALNQVSATWTGTEMIVYGALLDDNNVANSDKHAQGMAYDPRADRWRLIAPYPLSPQASSTAWTGAAMLAWDYELRAGLYEPASDTWRPLPELPLRFSECYPASARVGDVALAWYCGQGALFDIASASWRPVSPPGYEIFGPPVSTRSEVLFPGASYDGRGNALWKYDPEPSTSGQAHIRSWISGAARWPTNSARPAPAPRLHRAHQKQPRRPKSRASAQRCTPPALRLPLALEGWRRSNREEAQELPHLPPQPREALTRVTARIHQPDDPSARLHVSGPRCRVLSARTGRSFGLCPGA